VVPDTRANAVTVYGTAEQIAMAERYIPTVDAQLPQVSIEASLIEISEEGIKELSSRVGSSQTQFQLGFNNIPLSGNRFNNGASGLIGLPTQLFGETRAMGGIGFTTRPYVHGDAYSLQLKALVQKRKAKLLANPTVVATHDNEAIISIVEEIVRQVTTTLDPASGFVQRQVQLGEAGIVLDILPKIAEDGTVTMRVRPSISTIREINTDPDGNLITLLNKRDFVAQQVRMRDGETLVMGGLIQERNINQLEKFPGLGDLPIVGALMRASNNQTKRTELVMLITPHIISKTLPTPVSSIQPIRTAVRP
jgi:type II secretory pathway component GspD/PulD (secretin)